MGLDIGKQEPDKFIVAGWIENICMSAWMMPSEPRMPRYLLERQRKRHGIFRGCGCPVCLDDIKVSKCSQSRRTR